MFLFSTLFSHVLSFSSRGAMFLKSVFLVAGAYCSCEKGAETRKCPSSLFDEALAGPTFRGGSEWELTFLFTC